LFSGFSFIFLNKSARASARQGNDTFLLGAYFNGRPAERRLSELVDGGHTEAVRRVGS